MKKKASNVSFQRYKAGDLYTHMDGTKSYIKSVTYTENDTGFWEELEFV